MPGRQIAHSLDLNVGPLHRPRATAAEKLRLDPDGKELGVQSAFLCAHGVEMSIRQTPREIDILIDQTLRRIGMHIDDDCSPVN